MLGFRLPIDVEGRHRPLQIGVRPEQLRPVRGKDGFRGRVVHVENFGPEAFLHVGLGDAGTPVIARSESMSTLPNIGDDVTLGVDPHGVSVFDMQGRATATRPVPALAEAAYG